MANEAILRQEYSLPVNFTCADGTGIEQGAILKLADPMTASLSDGDEDYVAGICHTEKIANDGTTSVSVYIDGVFDIMCSGGVTAGQAVATASSTEGSNYVTAATATAIGCKTLGIALETSASGTEERILVRLNPGCNNTAYA
jgi:hypothetical protein